MIRKLLIALIVLLPAVSFGATRTHGLGSVTDEYICTWEAATSTLECDVNIDDYCTLAGCTMTGDITFPDNEGLIFGTTNQARVYYNATDLVFDLDSGRANFWGGVRVSSVDNEFSRFGGDPTVLNPNDTADIFVARKERTSTGGVRRGALFVGDDNRTTGTDATGQTYGLNSFVYTNPAYDASSSKATDAGGAVAGRYAFRHQGAGTFARGGGVASKASIIGDDLDGTITNGYAFLDEGGDGGAGTGYIDNYHGVWVRESIGNVNEKIGLYIESLQNATDNYGVKIDGASDGAFWMNNNTAIDGTFFWGTAKDTNLYRSAADTLMTDDDFVSAGVIKMNTTDQVATKPELVDEKCFYKNNPQTDQEWESIWHAPRAITIVQIWCETDAGTVAMDFEVDDGTPAGVNGSDVSCAAPNGTTDFLLGGDPTMAQGDRLDLDLGTVTTAVRLSACFKYTVD